MAKVESTIEEKGIYTLRSGAIESIDGDNICNDKELIVRLTTDGNKTIPKLYLGHEELEAVKLHGITMDRDLMNTINMRKLIFTGTSNASDVPMVTSLSFIGLPGENAVSANSTLINLKLNVVAKTASDIESSSLSVQLIKSGGWTSLISKTIEYSSPSLTHVIGELSFSVSNGLLVLSAQSYDRGTAIDNKSTDWKVEITSFLQI